MRLKKIRNISGSGMQGTVFYSSIDAQVIKVIRYEQTCSCKSTSDGRGAASSDWS